ncbi:MAG TPA: ACP S-malonyltransferase, partial [Chloroflexota bacterium]|nr:ACP S-malonyltransferase [Chloroflexota bacterium]
EGPDETLTETLNAQPAIFAASIALLRCLALPEDVAFVAGHSVGEYSALVAADAMRFEDALRLVQERGRLMHHAGTEMRGGMQAVMGLDDLAIEAACEAVAPLIVCPANYNAPGQTIISGEEAALEAVESELKARGAKRVIRLNVSAAFHSPVMTGAAAQLRQAIERVPIRAPRWPVVGNVSSQPLRTEADLRQELAEQIAAPVRWEASVRAMLAAGVTRFLEIGPGKVLTGMLRRIDPAAEAQNVTDLPSLHALAG